MLKYLKTFIDDESGATAIEYALLASLISVGILGGTSLLGNSLSNNYTDMGESVTQASTAFSGKV